VTILIVTSNRCGSRNFSNWLKKVMEFQNTLITSEKNTDMLYNVILNPMEVDDFYNTKAATKPINSGLKGLEDRKEKFVDFKTSML
jgi:hypothetical protein